MRFGKVKKSVQEYIKTVKNIIYNGSWQFNLNFILYDWEASNWYIKKIDKCDGSDK